MTDTQFVESPAGHFYPAFMKVTSNYWNTEKTPWVWVGASDLRGDLSYEFDEAYVWQHEDTGDVIIGADSGCSCPQPFEDTTLQDVEFIASLVDFDKFIEENESLTYSWSDNPSERYPEVVDQVVALRKKVETLLNG